MYESSLNIDADVKSIITNYSAISRISMSTIVKLLLKKVDKKYRKNPFMPGLIQYQRHTPDNGFEKLHYLLDRKEKDQFELMRARYKISISYLVLIGFLLFFDDLVNELSNLNNTDCVKLDSYPLKEQITKKCSRNNWILKEKET